MNRTSLDLITNNTTNNDLDQELSNFKITLLASTLSLDGLVLLILTTRAAVIYKKYRNKL